jgi:hypothetical protein
MEEKMEEKIRDTLVSLARGSSMQWGAVTLTVMLCS